MRILKNKFIYLILIIALLLSGCGKTTNNAAQEDPSIPHEAVEMLIQNAASDAAVRAAEVVFPFEFDPHVYSCFLSGCYSDDYREGLFNFIDALQEGRDTFECASKKVYDWCMDEVVQNQLYPVACTQITSKSKDGSKPYENGVGRIYYKKSKEDFMKRQEQFRTDITAIMDAYIKSNYSDFEKCLALYEYMVCNYVYDYDGKLDRSEDGSLCACLKYRTGVCSDFGALYAYLLLQSGVNAITVQNWGETDYTGSHEWTFVDIDRRGYHIDPTWGLKEDKSVETFTLDYFMMTDKDRADSGYPAELLKSYILPTYYVKDCDGYVFKADDYFYRLPQYSVCSRYDTRTDTLYYYNITLDIYEHQFYYDRGHYEY